MIALYDDREAKRVAAAVSHLEARGLMPIVREIATAYGVEPAAILARSRIAQIAHARHALCARLYVELGSHAHVGRVLELDHVTVLHACRQHARRSEAKR